MPSGPYSYELIDPSYSITAGAFSYVSVSQINDLGQVLGTVSGSAGVHPFLYANGEYTDLDVTGAISTTVTQLNNAGQVFGRYSDAAGSHSFIYQDGTYTDITVPDAVFTTAIQISSAGKVVGEYFDSTGLHPFIDDNGTYTTLSVPGATSTVVRAGSSFTNIQPVINDADQVIGRYVDGAGGHAFLYSDGNYTTLDVPGATSTTATEINNAGQVLGTYQTGSVTRPFLYSDGAYTTLAVPGATSTNVFQINDAGQVAGTYTNQTGTHLFLDTDGTYVTIDFPYEPPVSGGGSPFISASFNQLSNAGDVLGIGFGNTPLGNSEPFLYSDGTSSDVSMPGAASTTISGINDLGQLIGTFYDGLTNHSFLATPLCTDATQAAMLSDLLPATPDTVAAAQDSTAAGAALLAGGSDNTGLNAQLVLLNDQSSFGS